MPAASSSRLKPAALAPYVVLAVAPLLVAGPVLASHGAPPEGDARAHVFRINAFTDLFLGLGDFNPKWYHGGPFLSGYGPLFYAAGWAISRLIPLDGYTSALVAYKVMRLITMLLLAASTYLALRRLSLTPMVASALASLTTMLPPLLVVYRAGAFPYLLSFSLSLLGLVVGLGEPSKWRIASSSALLALSVYAHSYGLLNTLMACTCLLISYMRSGAGLLRALRYTSLTLLGALALSAPQVASMVRASALTSPLIDMPEGIQAQLATYTALVVIVTLLSLHLDGRPAALGLVTYLALSLGLAALSTLKGLHLLDPPLVGRYLGYVIPWRFLYVNCTVVVVVLAAAALGAKLEGMRFRKGLLVALAVGLLVAQASSTAVKGALVPSFTSAYPGLAEALRSSRLLVAGLPLGLSNSPVSACYAYPYTTSTGPYSQGDPMFFNLTVLYEWEDKYLRIPVALENLMFLSSSSALLTSVWPLGLKAVRTTPLPLRLGGVLACDRAWYEVTDDVIVSLSEGCVVIRLIPPTPLDLKGYDALAFTLSLLTRGIACEPVAVDVVVVDTDGTTASLRLLTLGPEARLAVVPQRGAWVDLVAPLALMEVEGRGADGVLNCSSIAEVRVVVFTYGELEGLARLAFSQHVDAAILNLRPVRRYGSSTLYVMSSRVYDAYRVKPVLLDVDGIIGLKLALFVNVLAPSGYKLTFTSSRSIPLSLVSAIIVDSLDKASRYTGHGVPVIVLREGSLRLERLSEGLYALYAPLALIDELIPYDPGVYQTYREDNLRSIPVNALYAAEELRKLIESVAPPVYEPVEASIDGATVRANASGRLVLVRLAAPPGAWRPTRGTRIYRDVYGYMLLYSEGEAAASWTPPQDTRLNVALMMVTLLLSAALPVTLIRLKDLEQ